MTESEYQAFMTLLAIAAGMLVMMGYVIYTDWQHAKKMEGRRAKIVADRFK